MEDLYLRQTACAVFLLLMGAARYHFSVAAGRQPADHSGPSGNWTHHLPAYVTSTAWVAYVVWRILAPPQLAWDRWALDDLASEILGWIGIACLVAGFALFWYSHRTIGRFWSLRIRVKQAHRLVTSGPYDYVRHPLYTAFFIGYLGTLLALQSWLLALWFPVFFGSYVLFAVEEEAVMERGFGDEYRVYRRQTGMFFPRWPRIWHDGRRAVAAAARMRRPPTHRDR